jgi:hypothetical protein
MSCAFTTSLAAIVRGLAIGAVLFAFPQFASAQSDNERQARWGVGFSFTPTWEITDQLTNLFDLDEGESLSLTGTELTIGVVRGSTRGGDWGVSFVRKPIGFNAQGPTGFRQVREEEAAPAEEELFAYLPLFKLEAEGDIVLAPGLKLKVAGGFNFPAYAFRIGASYRFGAE